MIDRDFKPKKNKKVRKIRSFMCPLGTACIGFHPSSSSTLDSKKDKKGKKGKKDAKDVEETKECPFAHTYL